MSSFLLRKAHTSEDALTGAFAEVLAWWPHRAAVLFTRARRFDGTRLLEPSGIPAHAGELRVFPWLRWPSGEPDLVLEFSHEGGRSLVIIEAKLRASKSSTDGEELPESEDAVADQLAKYFIDAIRGRDRRNASLSVLSHGRRWRGGEAKPSRTTLGGRAGALLRCPDGPRLATAVHAAYEQRKAPAPVH